MALKDLQILASFPGSHHKVPGSTNLIVGNPESVFDADTGDLPDAPAWSSTPDVTFDPDAKTRLIVVASAFSIEVVMTFDGQDPAALVATPIACPTNGQVSYSFLLPAHTTGLYVRNP